MPTRRQTAALLGRARANRNRAALLEDLHPGQKKAFLYFGDDGRRPSRIATLCPRRWGKTRGALQCAAHICLSRPNAHVAYISILRQSAKDIAWPELAKLNREYELGARPREIELSYTFPNGSKIRLYGADHPQFARLLRGQEFDFVVIDECQDFWRQDLQTLCREILDPALDDRRGTLVLIGTPGNQEAGFFFEVCVQGKHGFHFVQGDAGENPHNLDQQREREAEEKARNPDIEKEPWFQRERRGRWVIDNRQIIFPANPAVNYLYEWQQADTDLFVLGIDWGYDDWSGYSLLTWNPARYKKLISLEAWQRKEMQLSHHLEAINAYRARYPNLRVVADCAGGVKALVAELQNVHGIPIEKADKANKRFQIAHVQSDLYTGIIQIYNPEDPKRPQDNALARQWSKLVWEVDPVTKEKREGAPRHISDATVYARQAAAPDLHQPVEVAEKTDSQLRREKKQARLLRQRRLLRGRR